MKKILIGVLLILCYGINVYAYDYEIKSITITKNDVEYNDVPEKLAVDYLINIQIDNLVNTPINGKIIVAQYDKDNILCHCDIIPYKYNDDIPFQSIIKGKNGDYTIVVRDYDELRITGGGSSSGGSSGGIIGANIGVPIKHIHKIKVFVWDEIISQKPLSETSIII